MLYEVSLKRKYTINGETKEIKEQYLINDELFASVEQKAMALYANDCDVFAIKRSRAIEVINERKDDEHIYLAEMIRYMLDENTGVEKKTEYQVFLHSNSINEANEVMQQYVRQSMTDEEVKAIKKTKFIEVLI